MRIVALTLALLTVGASYASPPHHSNRTSAVAQLFDLVPDSAQIVIALNAEPSAHQKQVFQLLAPVFAKLKSVMSEPDESSPVPKGLMKVFLKEDFKGLVAFGSSAVPFGKMSWNGGGLSPDKAMAAFAKSSAYGALIPYHNGPRLEAALRAMDHETGAKTKVWNGVRYHLFGGVKVMTLPHAVVIASDPKTLWKVKAASHGVKRFDRLKSFARARARYSDDATLLVMTKLGSAKQPWGGGALTVRDDGIDLTVGPFSNGALGESRLPSNYASSLPGGAYLVLGIAVPEISKFSSQIPGLQTMSGGLGNLTVALYPSEVRGGKSKGADFLAEIGGTKKSDPTALFGLALQGIQAQIAQGEKLFKAIHISDESGRDPGIEVCRHDAGKHRKLAQGRRLRYVVKPL